MRVRIILKIYRDLRFRESGVMSAIDSFQKDASYLQDIHGLNKVTANKRDMIIKMPGYQIHYVANVNEFPHKIQGFRADIIEIMDRCLNEDILNSVISPMKHGGAEVVFLPDEYLD